MPRTTLTSDRRETIGSPPVDGPAPEPTLETGTRGADGERATSGVHDPAGGAPYDTDTDVDDGAEVGANDDTRGRRRGRRRPTPVEGATTIVEAATAEDAIAEVHATFGARARIVDARLVRSGGVGGFFAREVVQLHVAPPEPGADLGDLAPPDPGERLEGAAPDRSDDRPAGGADSPQDPQRRMSPVDRLLGDDRILDLDTPDDDGFAALLARRFDADPTSTAAEGASRRRQPAGRTSPSDPEPPRPTARETARVLARELAIAAREDAVTAGREAAARAAATSAAADVPATPVADVPATPPVADVPATPVADVPATPVADVPATPPVVDVPATPEAAASGDEQPVHWPQVDVDEGERLRGLPAVAATPDEADDEPTTPGPASAGVSPPAAADPTTIDELSDAAAALLTDPSTLWAASAEALRRSESARLVRERAEAEAREWTVRLALTDPPPRDVITEAAPADATAGTTDPITEPTPAPEPTPEPTPTTAPALLPSTAPGEVAWNATGLLRLGLPGELVHGIRVDAPHDDLAWVSALTASLRSLCRPLPAGDSVLVGPLADAELSDAAQAPAARSNLWLGALRDGRWVHLVVGGEGWRDRLDDEPLAVSWARPEDLPDAIRLAAELGLVLGYGPMGGKVRRARPIDVALAIRELVDER